MIFDVGNVLVNLYKFWKTDRELQAWIKLILSFVASGIIALTGTEGAMLIAGKSALIARGYGLAAAASSMLTVLLRSPQGRGLVLSVPQPVVKEYQAEGQTVIAPKETK